MQDELTNLRNALFAILRSDERQKNRRALLLAYKHIDKAARIMGAARQEIPKRRTTDVKAVYSPVEPSTAPEQGLILADNTEPATGKEKPVKAKRK